MSNPRLFIGSSTESLPLAEVLAKGLEGCADVVLWNTVFDPQKTYLATLLRIPESYDFALFVLGPDDDVLSRGKKQSAPRDNVVFEFGLFLEVLGLERTFPVVPQDVKMATDFLGWEWFRYDEPVNLKEFRAHIAACRKPEMKEALHPYYLERLRPVMQGVIDKIGNKIRQLGLKHDILVRSVAGGVHEIWPTIKDLVDHEVWLLRPLLVRHLALDLADAWDMLRDGVLQRDDIKNMTWRCLMIDPDSPEIIAADSPSVSRDTAKHAILRVEQTLSRLKQQLDARNLAFQCRAYSDLPRMHGFDVQDDALLLGMCDIDEEGRLDASRTPYFRFNAKNRAHSQHVIASFQHWFDYRWNRATRIIWPKP